MSPARTAKPCRTSDASTVTSALPARGGSGFAATAPMSCAQPPPSLWAPASPGRWRASFCSCLVGDARRADRAAEAFAPARLRRAPKKALTINRSGHCDFGAQHAPEPERFEEARVANNEHDLILFRAGF